MAIGLKDVKHVLLNGDFEGIFYRDGEMIGKTELIKWAKQARKAIESSYGDYSQYELSPENDKEFENLIQQAKELGI